MGRPSTLCTVLREFPGEINLELWDQVLEGKILASEAEASGCDPDVHRLRLAPREVGEHDTGLRLVQGQTVMDAVRHPSLLFPEPFLRSFQIPGAELLVLRERIHLSDDGLDEATDDLVQILELPISDHETCSEPQLCRFVQFLHTQMETHHPTVTHGFHILFRDRKTHDFVREGEMGRTSGARTDDHIPRTLRNQHLPCLFPSRVPECRMLDRSRDVRTSLEILASSQELSNEKKKSRTEE